MLGEALKQRLPHCAGDPHKVAYELNECFRRNDIRLLYDGVAAVPSTMLEIRAYVPPVGTAVLYVAVHGGRMPCSDNSWHWRPPIAEDPSSGSREHLERHHRYWTLDRASFEMQFGESSEERLPEPKNRSETWTKKILAAHPELRELSICKVWAPLATQAVPQRPGQPDRDYHARLSELSAAAGQGRGGKGFSSETIRQYLRR
jgi:hypothetical protein